MYTGLGAPINWVYLSKGQIKRTARACNIVENKKMSIRVKKNLRFMSRASLAHPHHTLVDNHLYYN